MRPEVKILAVSNVYCRLMNFKKKGDTEISHYHDYDHGTLLAAGKVRVEMVDDRNIPISDKVFEAPTFILIKKNMRHVLTALEDNTIASCIHALRVSTGDIVDPDFLIEETELADTKDKISPLTPAVGEIFHDKGLHMQPIASNFKRIKQV